MEKNPLKFDFAKLVTEVQDTFKKDKDKDKLMRKVGTACNLKVFTDDDFIRLGEWWTIPTQTKGIPFNALTLIAGTSDSGKTESCIQFMLAAQQQGVGIIYCESEVKTQKNDLIRRGINPEQVMLIQARLAEEAFEYTHRAIDIFRSNYPEAPLLVIIDSLGNMLSQRDAEMDMMKDSAKVGGKSVVNRIGLNGLVARMEADTKMAIVLVSYTYDNIGSPGKTNAGGTAMNFFSSLTYQTSRKGWVEKIENGVKKRIGAEVLWKLYKNHINKDNPGLKEITFRITDKGFEFVNGKED